MARQMRQPKDRSRLMLAVIAGGFALALFGLWLRAGWVQLVQGERLAGLARRQHLAAEFERGERGVILDRSSRVLAKSVRFTSVYARPVEIEDAGRTAAELAQVLEQPMKPLTAQLKSTKNFVWIERQIDDKAAARLKDKDLKGIYLTTEYGRLYPNGHLAGQLLGFANIDGQGIEGLERAYESVLAGKTAEFVVQRDASGRRLYLDAHGREVDIDGDAIRLTLDGHVQDLAEAALAEAVVKGRARWGSCLVVEVESGEVLALASYPFFNPNVKAKVDPASWRNRPATDVFEPGSTMKPFVVSAALQEKVVRPENVYFCENGKWRYSGKTIRDDVHHYDWLTVNKIIRYSSNIGAAKIGLDLGARKYHQYLSALGFGQKTALDMPGESSGFLRPPERWYPIDLAAASFGQSVGVTLLQMAEAYLCLASDGLRKPLRLVLDPTPELPAPVRVFSPEVARTMRAMMLEVVEADGTGQHLRIPGVPMAAKTGTAQKASPQGGYGDKHVASFAAFIPGDAPKYLILAVIDEPGPVYYGGVVAGPVVRQVGVNLLAYKGRLPDTGLVAAAPAPAGAGGEGAGLEEPVARVQPAAVAAGSVPDVTGLSLRKAVEVLAAKGVVPRLEGTGGLVGKQNPAPGSAWPAAGEDMFTLWLTS